MFYNFVGNRIIKDIEKKMNIKDLAIYEFESSNKMATANEQYVPELTLKWKTTNPSLTIYEISSQSFNTNFKDDQYKNIHIVSLLLNQESSSSTLTIKVTAEDITGKTYASEFYYFVNLSQEEAITQ
jgi:hypothetical protein